LCALCDDKTTCSYDNTPHHGHFGALQCLTRGNGKVAYVALHYVHEYLGVSRMFYLSLQNGY